MTIRIAAISDAEAIAEIYAPIVTDTGISFEDVAPTGEEIAERIELTLKAFPWLVFEKDGDVVGYAYAAAHRTRAAYRWSCETSVYVGEGARRTGAARKLYTALFDALRNLGYVNALAGITLPNEPSVGFHQAMGFELIGVYKSIGFKSGEWRDVGWWNYPLQSLGDSPANPRLFDAHRDETARLLK